MAQPPEYDIKFIYVKSASSKYLFRGTASSLSYKTELKASMSILNEYLKICTISLKESNFFLQHQVYIPMAVLIENVFEICGFQNAN